ncbi:MAG: hypothetical protein OEV89_05975 [Desulfobulbaceae bacterium]|nr:hypothetical protein [Desulfobulbaceae bacterium]HIJ90300.1 hypothetical protein [Deltaproteobacteria bacterium]
MNTILNRFDRLMMAVTFAEANEPELAHKCIGSRKQEPAKQLQQNAKITAGRILPNQTAR